MSQIFIFILPSHTGRNGMCMSVESQTDEFYQDIYYPLAEVLEF